MATRTFDYKTVESIYLEMNKIIGDNNETDSLSGILVNMDKNYRDVVGQIDEACYGALGDQLLLDWENTSSDFPKFIENFHNWASLVSSASGDYAQFEQQVTGLQQENQYGFAGAGLQNNYVESSAYHDYAANNEEAFKQIYGDLNYIYQLTGCTYLQSGASGRLKTKHIMDTVLLGGDVLAIAVIAAGAYSYFAGAPAAGTELATVEGGGGAVTTTGGTAAGGTGATGAATTELSTVVETATTGGAGATGATGATSAVDIAAELNNIRELYTSGQISKGAMIRMVKTLAGGTIPDGSVFHTFLAAMANL